MSTMYELPGWAAGMQDAPTLVTYCGHVQLAIPWEASTSRRRFSITLGNITLDMNVAQAEALRDMLDVAVNTPGEHQ